MKVRDRVFGAKVDPDIIKIINNLQDGSFESNPNEPIKEYSDYLGDRTTYARMWTAVTTYPHEEIADETEKQKQDRISKTAKNSVYIVNENRENSYDVNPNESIGIETKYISQLSENPYLKPSAGITSVSSKTEGSLGVLRRTSVEFIIHNKIDFENIFLPFFLRPGARVCVDFGWSDKRTSELYDPVDQITNKDLTMEQFDSFIYGNMDDDDNIIVGELNKPLNVGLMNTVVGDVVNYDVKLTELGSFECNLELISRNTSLLDKGVDDDNALKYVFTNFIEDYLLQMLIHRKGIKTDFDEGSLDAFRDVVDEKARKKLLDTLTSTTAVGKIDQVSSQLGFYYQDLGDNTDDGENDKEMIYINYGLFEDFFLNNIVVNYRDVTAESDKGINVKSQIKYDSSENFIRYVSDLEDLQKLPLTDSDDLPTFLYNTYWENSYNSNPKADKQIGKDNNKRKNFLRNRLKKEPIRELFISVDLIKESFERASNVNDALVNIWGSINDDSFDIFNVQMTPNNEAGTSVGFHDIFITENQEQELIFDVTSHRSIVKSADLTFKTPKSGLSSMIAISNLSEPTVFSQNDLANFNMLNILKKDSNKNEKTIIRSLPLTSDNDLENVQGFGGIGLSAEDIEEFSNAKGLVSSDNSTGLGDTDPWEFYDRYFKGSEAVESDEMNTAIKNYYDSLKQAKEDAESEEKDKEDDKENKETPKNESEKNVIIVNSEREQLGQQARKNALLVSGENTISPILPVDLTLTVYGNNYLVVGDVFSVNFLPKHYQDRIFFQIIGVEHKISTTGWDTTYNTVMRVKSTKKKIAYGSVSDLDRIFAMKIKPSKKMIEKNLTVGNVAVTDEFKKSVTEAVTLEANLFFPPHDLNFTLIDMERDVDRTLEDKEKTKSKKRKLNAYGLYTRFAGGGLKDPFSFATMYALTTFFIPNDKTNPDFNLDMDLFKPRYTGEGRVNVSGTDKKGESSEIKILANRKDDGKSGELRKSIDATFDENFTYGVGFGDTETETAVVKFTQQMQSQFKLDNIEHQFDLGSLPIIDGILYNITGDEKFYQMKLNRQIENIFIVPRLMKKKNFGVGDLKKFCQELAIRTTVMETLMSALIAEEQNLPVATGTYDELANSYRQPEPENPGYPFTSDNYSATPFGTYPTAFDARLKLAQAFGLDSYIAYKHSKTLEERKADWDSNPDIWESS